MFIVWIDMAGSDNRPDAIGELPSRYNIQWLNDEKRLTAILHSRPAHAICFDYEIPDSAGLLLLQRTKAQWPHIPLLMFTRQHSERLAVWALRSRVWDYLVKPVSGTELCIRLDMLAAITGAEPGRSARRNLMPVPAYHDRRESDMPLCKTAPALIYIERHLEEKIVMTEAARCCGMGRFVFSHTFTREHGISFREFVTRRRITCALELLGRSRLTVTEIAFRLGFSDLSYFARLFRMYTGFTPSAYRSLEPAQQSAICAATTY